MGGPRCDASARTPPDVSRDVRAVARRSPSQPAHYLTRPASGTRVTQTFPWADVRKQTPNANARDARRKPTGNVGCVWEKSERRVPGSRQRAAGARTAGQGRPRQRRAAPSEASRPPKMDARFTRRGQGRRRVMCVPLDGPAPLEEKLRVCMFPPGHPARRPRLHSPRAVSEEWVRAVGPRRRAAGGPIRLSRSG